MGFVIGRNGNTIKQIQRQSGARIPQSEGVHAAEGFMVCGTEDERTCAIQLINKKVVSATVLLFKSVCVSLCVAVSICLSVFLYVYLSVCLQDFGFIN